MEWSLSMKNVNVMGVQFLVGGVTKNQFAKNKKPILIAQKMGGLDEQCADLRGGLPKKGVVLLRGLIHQ